MMKRSNGGAPATGSTIGTGSVPSIHRRRGTTTGGSSNAKKLIENWKSPFVLLGCIACTLGFGLVALFIAYGGSDSSHHPLNRHIVQSNLLRQHVDPVERRGGDSEDTTTKKTTSESEKIIIESKKGKKLDSTKQFIQKQNQRKDHEELRHNHHHVQLEDEKRSSQQKKSPSIDLNLYDRIPTEEYPYDILPTDPSYDIASEYIVLGGNRFIEYTTGGSPYIVTQEHEEKSNEQALSRLSFIRSSMQFVWSNYVEHAFGMDELHPQSGRGSNNWGGQGITLVDSLDTLWLMGMIDEFHEATEWVRNNLKHDTVNQMESVFETTIRDLGGLLSAYDWSGESILLEKALDLGERLLKAFDHSDTGLPFGQINLGSGIANNVGWTGSSAILSEFGTLQLEFKYLATILNRPELCEKTDHVFDIMNQIAPENGLYPYFYSNSGRGPGSLPEPRNHKITFGAMSDSFYEYMLKLWLLTDRKIPMYRDMYDKAIDGMHDELLQTSTPSGLTYIADKNDGNLDHKMDHLVCFMGGLLALGAYTDPNGLDSPRAQRDLRTGKALTYTCYQMYARMKTGISAEFVQFHSGTDFGIGSGAPHYLLRPEAVESLFILHSLTKDPIYREWGWEIYQSIEKYCKTKYGYGALNNVQSIGAAPRDSMESFFLAETMKYLYLLQDPNTPVDILHTHVFNTEAHPVRILSKINETRLPPPSFKPQQPLKKTTIDSVQ